MDSLIPYILISTFDSVVIHNNTLVLCDIDETVIHFKSINKQWWSNKFDEYYSQSHDYDLADIKVFEDWITHIKENDPVCTDLVGLTNLLNKLNDMNGTFVFITARNNDELLIELTKIHLQQSGIYDILIDVKELPVYFCGGNISKGQFIKDNINIDDFDHVIFIDDLESNLESVHETFIDTNITLYKFHI